MLNVFYATKIVIINHFTTLFSVVPFIIMFFYHFLIRKVLADGQTGYSD